ncbi:MAG: proton-conducting transporter membrane subunit [Lutibacter sp.]|nr:proton-conducting transporter membrane subunit [Lutibacter sp.]
MAYIQTYIAILAVSLLAIPFLKVKWKGIITLSLVVFSAIWSGYLVLPALLGEKLEFVFQGSIVTGEIPIRIDALSAWFILLINFTIITGALYGLYYMKAYRKQASNLTLHCVAYLLAQTSLMAMCVIQNSLVFLFAWEIMTISTFLLIIFEYYKQDTLKAGINFLIQSHAAILFLTLGFIWVYYQTGSYDFVAISQFSINFPPVTSLALFFFFFIGFAVKAGFVPFHTWLPYAHPVAPSHISGVMSGVIIKIGIFGILRMLQLIQTDYVVLGYIILVFSVISGIYGVMLAILQHDLKKLLAYHSIENIGIIGIGIGLGTLGIGQQNTTLILLGFGGALLHVLNHSLFKSLLFYSAGNVYQATHTLNIEHFGGLVKQMPQTTILFLIAALAICGLPPFNGFVSEFLIYSGLFDGMASKEMLNLVALLFSVFGLVLIGGLALLCFTKAFGAMFLGNPRHLFHTEPKESNLGKLVPMYMAATFIVVIGLFPQFFFSLISEPLKLYTGKINFTGEITTAISITETMQTIGFSAMGFIALALLIFLIRNRIIAQKSKPILATWSCGYVGETEKMQYTASSFIRSYRKLAEPMLSIKKNKIEVEGIFPITGRHETHPYDKIEEWLIDKPWSLMKLFFGKFRFLQNGNPQFYVLYGVTFIALIISIPIINEIIKKIIYFLNQI